MDSDEFHDSGGGNGSDGVNHRLDFGDIASKEDKEVRGAMGKREYGFSSDTTCAGTGDEECFSFDGGGERGDDFGTFGGKAE